MKVTINIECTPEEARSFMGLPDFSELHATVVREMQGQMEKAMRTMDPDQFMKYWVSPGLANMEQWQKLFWQGMGKSGQ
ncbi:MAG TPA: DUF6489 family protein [Dongiaceae bacterium]|jgi:hypothetical protein|nr:DUF6489 family protein [Dongiaceae bacterium]